MENFALSNFFYKSDFPEIIIITISNIINIFVWFSLHYVGSNSKW